MLNIRMLRNLNKINLDNSDYYTLKFYIEGTPLGNPKQPKLNTESGTFCITSWINQENYEENIKSKYDSLVNTSSFSELSKALTMMGAGSLQSKYMARKVWVDIDAMSFSFNMFFQAEDNAYTDVESPIRNLQALVVPINTTVGSDQETLFLYPPTKPMIVFPSVTKFFKEKKDELAKMFGASGSVNLVGDSSLVRTLKLVKIGKFISLRNIILEEVNTSWNIMDPDPSGIPLNAEVNVKMTTYDLWTLKTIIGLIKDKKDDEIKAINIDNLLKKVGINLEEVLKAFV
jgi:hypothetical protein